MSVPTTAWSETTPPGSAFIREGDDRIREKSIQFRELFSVDHEMASSGQGADWGKHNQITLIEQADVGAGSTGYCALGAQTTVAGPPELVFTDESNTDVQITDAGFLNGSALVDSGSLENQDLKDAIRDFCYPVGAVFISEDATSPQTWMGGTWEAYGAGTFLVCRDSGDTDFDTAGETGGAKTATLSEANLPAHRHLTTISGTGGDALSSGNSWSGDNNVSGDASYFGRAQSGEPNVCRTSATGSGTAFSILPPYTVVYAWKRTA